MTEHEPDYPYGDIDWGLPAGTTVTVPCVRCSLPVTVEWDPGEPMTRDHPGDPGGWYPSDESCDCVNEYDSDEQQRFEDARDSAIAGVGDA